MEEEDDNMDTNEVEGEFPDSSTSDSEYQKLDVPVESLGFHSGHRSQLTSDEKIQKLRADFIDDGDISNFAPLIKLSLDIMQQKKELIANTLGVSHDNMEQVLNLWSKLQEGLSRQRLFSTSTPIPQDIDLEDDELDTTILEPLSAVNVSNDDLDNTILEPLSAVNVSKEVLYEKLKTVFGHNRLRGEQEFIIEEALKKQDMLIMMRTGFGKSLCYQLPGVLEDKLTVVISPLKALMNDQTEHLKKLKIGVVSFIGEKLPSETLLDPDCTVKFIYCTPEKLVKSRPFVKLLEQLYKARKISRFVIDEGHCVMTWGQDFRQVYSELGVIRKKFPVVPIMVLTGTASASTRSSIVESLGIEGCTRIIGSIKRNNISLNVTAKPSKYNILDFFDEELKDKRGIVYCLARKDAEDLALKLEGATPSVTAKAYHGGLEDNQRKVIQQEWMEDKFLVICATSAFGLGIDKQEVDFVIHQSIPGSIEEYYQEVGRCGRNGMSAKAFLLYNYNDVARRLRQIDELKSTIEVKDYHKKNLLDMMKFCETKNVCRQNQVLEFFNEPTRETVCDEVELMEGVLERGRCDVCTQAIVFVPRNLLTQTRLLVNAIQCDGAVLFTVPQLVDIVRKPKDQRIMKYPEANGTRVHGVLAGETKRVVRELLVKLIIDGILYEIVKVHDKYHFAYSKISVGGGWEVIKNDNHQVLLYVENKPKDTLSPGTSRRSFNTSLASTSTNNRAAAPAAESVLVVGGDENLDSFAMESAQ